MAAICLLPSCGGEDAPALTMPNQLLQGNAPPAAGPSLRGTSRATSHDESAPQARMQPSGKILVPPGASWDSLRAALHDSRALRIRREELDDTAQLQMLVPLPGVSGHVTVGGVPPVDRAGLVLRLVRTEHFTRASIQGLGTEWTAAFGCDAQTTWEAIELSGGAWPQALESLLGTGLAPSRYYVQIEADARVPAHDVVACMASAARAGVTPYVDATPGRRRKFEDATDSTLQWLAAHQLPDARWNENLAPAYCDGLRMEQVELPPDEGGANDIGLTALVLTVFLEAGYTNRGKHSFNRTVGTGLRLLKRSLAPEGNFGGASPRDHALALHAMLEAYGMTGSPLFMGAANRGLAWLPTAWRTSRDDPVASVFMALGIHAAREINADQVKRGKPSPLVIPEGFPDGLLQEARTESGSSDHERAAAGLLGRLLLGDDPDAFPEIDQGALRLVRYFETAGIQGDPLLTWLIARVALHARVHSTYQRMRVATQPLTCRADGHACCFKGSFELRSDSRRDHGRVATTAFLALARQPAPCYSYPWRASR